MEVPETIALMEEAEPTVLAPPEQPTLRIGPLGAVGMFFAYLGAQMGIAVVIITAALIFSFARDSDNFQKRLQGTIDDAQPATIILSVAGSGVAIFALALIFWLPLFRDHSSTGFAFRIGHLRGLLISAASGMVLGGLWLAVVRSDPPPVDSLGPLAKLASQGGWGVIAISVVAVFLAPPVEEFLFRGVMFAGFSRRWGVPVAGMIVTILFVAMHLFENIHYWPGIVAVTTLAILALILRLRTQSLGAPIVLHVFYNSMIVGSMLLST